MAVSKQRNRTYPGCVLVALCVMSTTCGASGTKAPADGRLEHPAREAPAPVVSAEPMASIPEPVETAPGPVETAPEPIASPTKTASVHKPTALVPTPRGQFTPLDHTIAEDCEPDRPGYQWARPWSNDVPDSQCKTDGECGDGFCDRGRCAAIWSCIERYGQRCINGKAAHIPGTRDDADGCRGICTAGRCRSCVSDAECIKVRGDKYAKCEPQVSPYPGRTCTIDDPNIVPSTVGPMHIDPP